VIKHLLALLNPRRGRARHNQVNGGQPLRETAVATEKRDALHAHAAAFLQGANLVASTGFTCSGAPCALPTPTGSGQVLTFTFLDVQNPNTNDTSETLAFDVQAVVADVPSSTAGTSFTVPAVLTQGATNVPITSAPLTIIEPSPTFVATSTPATGQAGDTVTVTVQVSNPVTVNGAPATNAGRRDYFKLSGFSGARSLVVKMPSFRMSSPSNQTSPPPHSGRWISTMSQCTADLFPFPAVS